MRTIVGAALLGIIAAGCAIPTAPVDRTLRIEDTAMVAIPTTGSTFTPAAQNARTVASNSSLCQEEYERWRDRDLELAWADRLYRQGRGPRPAPAAFQAIYPNCRTVTR